MNIGGLFKSLINPATLMQLAMGPMGWATLATKMVMSAVGQQVIQMLGEKLGLPQGMIDFAKTAFTAASGTQGMPSNVADAVQTVARQFNMSPSQQGELQRTVDRAIQDSVQEAWQNAERSGASKGRAAGKSWLAAIADSIGKAIDRKIDSLEALADKADKSRQASTDYQVAVQEFNLLMTTLTTTIKTIGEALSSLARKQ